jgi:hypothetical protein
LRTRLIDVPATGTFVSVDATQTTRRVEIIEDFSANAGVGQGLDYQFKDGNTPPFTTVYSVAPQSEPIILGEPIPQGKGYGRVIGCGPDNSGGYSVPATLLIKLSSASATPTVVRVTEFD